MHSALAPWLTPETAMSVTVWSSNIVLGLFFLLLHFVPALHRLCLLII